MMAQLAYHISTGTPLWGYKVRKSTVLYFAHCSPYSQAKSGRYFRYDFRNKRIDGSCRWSVCSQQRKRTSNNATLDVAGKDQQDMKIHLVRDAEN